MFFRIIDLDYGLMRKNMYNSITKIGFVMLTVIRRPAGVFCGLFWLVLLALVSIYGLYLRADFSTA